MSKRIHKSIRVIGAFRLSTMCLLLASLVVACGDGWTEVVSKEGNFSGRMPNMPSDNIFPRALENGERMDIHIYSLRGIRAQFTLSHYKLPLAIEEVVVNNPALILDITTALNSGDKVVSKSDINVDSFPGVDLKWRSADGTRTVIRRIVIANAVAYELVASYEDDESLSSNAQKFLASFRLLKS